MALRTKQNDWRLLPLLTLVFLGINILGCEWSWGSNIPLLLSWLIQSTPIVGLFLLAAASGAFVLESFSDHARCWIYFWLGIYILVLLGGILIWFTSSPSPWIYVGLAQALIGGLVGAERGRPLRRRSGLSEHWRVWLRLCPCTNSLPPMSKRVRRFPALVLDGQLVSISCLAFAGTSIRHSRYRDCRRKSF